MNDQEITKQVDEETSYIPLKDLETLPDAILAQLYTMGGQLPGYGGGDKVLVLLEPGEFVIRKESAAHYGESFLHALNDMRLDASSINTEHAHADGPGETVFFDFRPPAGIPAEQARNHHGPEHHLIVEDETTVRNLWPVARHPCQWEKCWWSVQRHPCTHRPFKPSHSRGRALPC